MLTSFIEQATCMSSTTPLEASAQAKTLLSDLLLPQLIQTGCLLVIVAIMLLDRHLIKTHRRFRDAMKSAVKVTTSTSSNYLIVPAERLVLAAKRPLSLSLHDSEQAIANIKCHQVVTHEKPSPTSLRISSTQVQRLAALFKAERVMMTGLVQSLDQRDSFLWEERAVTVGTVSRPSSAPATPTDSSPFRCRDFTTLVEDADGNRTRKRIKVGPDEVNAWPHQRPPDIPSRAARARRKWKRYCCALSGTIPQPRPSRLSKYILDVLSNPNGHISHVILP